MPLSYIDDTHLQDLESVLDDYTQWFLQVIQRLFYPSQNHPGFAKPESFDEWVKTAEAGGGVKPAILERLTELHQDLGDRANLLMAESEKSQTPLQHNDYRKLTVLFEEFIGQLRRLEKDSLLGDSGMDALTGLRSKNVMEKDIGREMERLARQGKPFSIAMVRIDDFESLRNENPPAAVDECLRIVAGFIKQSMRSFDDAYYMEDGTFILSLKQTGTSGGIQALKRVKSETDASKATFTINGQKKLLSLSSCIGEPGHGEEVSTFLANLKKDMTAYGENGGSILEFAEMSALQRYVRDKG